jgi:hypothetical protein
LPHGAFDAAAANRFGMEQAQPLVHLAANANAIGKSMIELTGSPAVSVSALKSAADGKSVTVHLRSVSEKDEKVQLKWPGGNPKSVTVCTLEQSPGKVTGSEVLVPAMGLVVLVAAF